MSLSRDATLVIKGPRKVLIVIGSTEYELGYTRGGITARYYEATTYEVDTDQVGPIDEIIERGSAQMTTPLLQLNKELLATLIPGSVLTTGTGGAQKLEVGTLRGYSLRQYAKPLILRPESKTSSDKSDDFMFWLAVPTGPVEINFNNQASNEAINVVWKALVDTTKGLTNNLYCLGDPAVTAE